MQEINIPVKAKIKRVAIKKLLIDFEMDIGTQTGIEKSIEADVDILIS